MLHDPSLLVREATARDAPAWDAYLDSDASRPPFAAWGWQSVLAQSYGVTCRFLLAEDAHGIRGVLPTYVSRSTRQMFGLRFGLAARDGLAEAALLQAAAAVAQAQRTRGLLVCNGYRPLATAHDGWTSASRCTLLLDVSAGEDAVWAALRDKTRNAIRKGMRSGARAEWGIHNLAGFYAAYLDLMSGKARAAHSLTFFRSMFAHLGERVQLLCAVVGEGVVGGTVVLRSSGAHCSTFQAVRPGANADYAATSLMEWEMARGAMAANAATLDMGESAPGSGTYAFKSNFGGRPADVHYYRHGSAGGDARQGEGEVHAMRATAIRWLGHAPAAIQRRVALWRGTRGRII